MILHKFTHKFTVRSIVVLMLVIGSFGLAVIDKEYRPFFGHLADIGLGGYLAQLIPKSKDQSE